MDSKPQQHENNLTAFYHVLANNLVVSITNFTVWFAITFFMYLQTRSVFATSIVAGIYLVAMAVSGFWFGSIVDHNKKKKAMFVSSTASLAFYLLSLAVYLASPATVFKDPSNPLLWVFVVLLLCGVIVGNIRTIAMPTLVTILIEPSQRDKANGLVGTIWGISFLITSVLSGFLVGLGGMVYVLAPAIIISILAMLHLARTAIPEKGIVHTQDKPKKIDIRGTLKVIFGIPGLFALIIFTTFNNFLGGVYMSLMDAYGLSLMSVQAWGLLWGVLSLGFIVGGMLIAKRGLGKNPLRTMFLANVIIWGISSVFTLQSSILLLAVGMFMYLCIMPFIEAAEQTILQRVVPLERQGRVFGFAQSVEQSASPLTAFMIGPLTQFIFIPFMTNGAGVDLIGGWFGTGPDRGIALVFTVAGLVGLLATLLAMSTKYYRQLSAHYLAQK